MSQVSESQSVYIAKAGENIKIGRSVDPESRVKDLSVGNPISVELLHTISVESSEHTAKGLEEGLQNHCERWSKNGEWFEKEAYYFIAGMISGLGVKEGAIDFQGDPL